jgi:hypothetical protein
VRKYALTVLLLSLAAATAFGMWAQISLEHLVRETDLVIVGVLHSVVEGTEGRVDSGSGVIDVHEVIWGAAPVGDSLVLKWSNPAALACPRVEHRHHKGSEAIWLLEVARDGTVRADYPGRTLPLSKREDVINALEEASAYVSFERLEFRLGSPVMARFLYRNFSADVAEYPGMAVAESTLFVDPAVKLEAFYGPMHVSEPVPFRSGRLAVSPDLSPLRAEPMSETGVNVDLAALLTMDKRGSYRIELTVEGCGPRYSRRIELY